MKLIVFLCLFCLSFVSSAQTLILSKSNENKDLVLNSYKKDSMGYFNFSKAQIVRFSKMDDVVSLVSIDNSLKYDFKILKDDKAHYEVDLASGLKSIYFQSSIFKSELSLSHPEQKRYEMPASVFSSLDILENDSNRTLIKIGLKLEKQDSFFLELVKDKMNHFSSKRIERENEVGFYATYPNSSGEMFLSKQKLPLHYTYSEKMPEDILLTLKRAISYWNKVLGSEQIFLKKEKSGESPMKLGSHFIEYLANKDNDGGARGVFNLDPRNGMILSSYIYVPSGFKVWANKYFKEKYPAIKKSSLEIMVQDYLTHTLAHEIGHSLGLRHNFAASNESTITFQNYEDIFKQYESGQTLDAKDVPAASVMDYISIDYFALMGAKMRLNHAPLSYDNKAIRWLYSNEVIASFGDYCTHFSEPPSVEDGGVLFCQAWDVPHEN